MSASSGSSSRTTGEPWPGCRPSDQNASATASGRPVSGSAISASRAGFGVAHPDQLVDQGRDLRGARVRLVGLRGDRHRLQPVPRAGAGEELVEEVVRRRGQQLAAGREELRVVLDLPELRVVRDPLRPQDLGLERAEVVGGVEPVQAHGRRRGEEGEVGDRVDLGAAVAGLRERRLGEDLVHARRPRRRGRAGGR